MLNLHWLNPRDIEDVCVLSRGGRSDAWQQALEPYASWLNGPLVYVGFSPGTLFIHLFQFSHILRKVDNVFKVSILCIDVPTS
jgi:hypothetical protein